MTGPVDRAPVDPRWVEAMFADVQRQIDELSGQLAALANVVQAQTIGSLARGEPYGLGQQLAHRPAGAGEPVVFIGEGAADVLALHQMGRAHAAFPDSLSAYAVAPCGTAVR